MISLGCTEIISVYRFSFHCFRYKCLQDCVLDSVNGPLPNWHINLSSGTCLRVESPQNLYLAKKRKRELWFWWYIVVYLCQVPLMLLWILVENDILVWVVLATFLSIFLALAGIAFLHICFMTNEIFSFFMDFFFFKVETVLSKESLSLPWLQQC